ncbi:MAG: HNH endonuclease [Spirulina sp. SIO3F2]|nr:HNH endonuclease [Spirulina sp. SIO3F2]
MEENFASELNQLYQEYLIGQAHRQQVIQRVDSTLAKVDWMLAPRRQFTNWARSQAGQSWKRQQFKRQDSRCARCKKKFRNLSEAEIHHVRSLHESGRQANNPKNYRLLCTPCNRQLGTTFDKNL